MESIAVFFPKLNSPRSIDYLEQISSPRLRGIISPSLPVSQSSFPVWKDELYLELHRGCYTVHGEQKKSNRYCERLLYEAELWSTLATLLCKDKFVSQPLFPNISTILEKEDLCQANCRQLIEVAWKKSFIQSISRYFTWYIDPRSIRPSRSRLADSH